MSELIAAADDPVISILRGLLGQRKPKPHAWGMWDGSLGGKAGLMPTTGIQNLPKPLACPHQGPAHGSEAGLTQHPALSLVLRS
jgi:hypothetical protein